MTKKMTVPATLHIHMGGRYAGNNVTRALLMQFEQHVRYALATRATARQVDDMQRIDASYFIGHDEASIFCSTLPQMRWFQA